MKILIINAILYTNEDKIVKKVSSIRDCMIRDLCRAFAEEGHDITLIAAEEYKPLNNENFPFKIVWMKSYFKRIFTANKIPFNAGILKHLKKNRYDLIISSEVFSLDTLLAVVASRKNLIIWQEMAFHQKMAKQMASKFWHQIIVKLFYKGVCIVPRTENARKFISQYSNNVSERVIQHGIDLDKFNVGLDKDNSFIVSSQLIKRKRIDLIIRAFGGFVKKSTEQYKLYIAGDGDKKESLMRLAAELKIQEYVVFLGKLNHKSLVEYLSRAKAMLVYTEKDNSMIPIAEAIAVATPVISTSIPDNSKYIRDFELGIVSDNWGWKDLKMVADKNEQYVDNCIKYRNNLDNKHNVDLFIEEMKKMQGAINSTSTQR